MDCGFRKVLLKPPVPMGVFGEGGEDFKGTLVEASGEERKPQKVLRVEALKEGPVDALQKLLKVPPGVEEVPLLGQDLIELHGMDKTPQDKDFPKEPSRLFLETKGFLEVLFPDDASLKEEFPKELSFHSGRRRTSFR